MFDQSINGLIEFISGMYVCRKLQIAKATAEHYLLPPILSMMRIQRDLEPVLMHF